MEKEFVPYEQALALKELGFEYVSTIFAYDEAGELYTRSGIPHDFNIRGLLSAPTFSQAFRWFREKYNLHQVVLADEKGKYDIIVGERISGSCLGQYSTYEEAELECLKKLIEIVKEK
jgi:hypothetical protein